MPGTASEESIVGRSFEGISSGQLQCQSGEAIAEWRSSEQVENGSPSTSPPYWDTDDEDGCGPKPPELYGKYTWKIDKFSHINKRELRSNAFEVGGYKWYILIYPQGCDVCNHLSLFLCVANHDKLLPGWSHFAQFTIAVVNKDPKKSKYSDTLHRFWKKEHDWGWKKFMELSKLLDGFIDADTLIIKAQVQVIREKVDRPFRCLDRQYRRELVRVYLTNVEQICRRFVEERRGKLGKLIEDKARWLSFRSFWMGMDQNAQRHMSREKTDSILKVVVKHFFIEKEVTSTLVMDSLYSGLKALEGLNKSKKCKGKSLDAEEQLVPIVHIEQDIFALVDDVLLLLERAALEPLPPKDEKGPQNRTKDGVSGEDFNKDSIERDERRLTELGRRTIEIFVLAHIFSKIEVAYQEAVALKRQEELIREEEAAWLAESEQKAKRAASEKEKKSKRKQGKQRRNNRKGKDKGKDERLNIVLLGKAEQESVDDGRKYCLIEEAEPVLEKADVLEDISDVSDSIDCIPEILPPDSDDRDTSPVNWDTDTSEVHPFRESGSGEVSSLSVAQNVAVGKKGLSVLDDSSSTCSTDSVRSVAMNTPNKGNSFPNNKSQRSPIRGKNQRGTDLTVWSSEVHSRSSDLTGWSSEVHSRPFDVARDVNQPNDVSENCKAAESVSQAVEISLHDRIKWPDLHEWKKEEVISLHRECSIKDEADMGRPQTDKAMKPPSSPNSPSKILPFAGQPKSDSVIAAANDTLSNKKEFSDGPKQMDKATSLSNLAETTTASRPMAGKTEAPRPIGKPLVQQVTVTVEKPSTLRVIGMSRPLSAPLIPGPRPTVPVVSVVQTMPLLARSVSAAGRLGPESSHTSHGYVPQSYRNAIMGSTVPASSAGLIPPHSLNPLVNSSASYSQLSSLISAPIYLPQNPERMEANSIKTSFSFGMVNHDVLPNGSQWMDYSPRVSNRSIHSDHLSQHNDITNFDLYKPVCSRSQDHFISEYPASPSTSGRPNSGLLVEDFPHLDIINDLLDDEHGMGKVSRAGDGFQTFSSGPHQLNRQFTFPGYMGSDMGPSTSSCRFERTRRYLDDGLQRGFAYPVGGNFDTAREMISQSSPPTYANGEIDGLIPNHWQMAGSDLSMDSMLRMRNTENDAYLYHVSDYTNLACGVNGYAVFRPSHGH